MSTWNLFTTDQKQFETNSSGLIQKVLYFKKKRKKKLKKREEDKEKKKGRLIGMHLLPNPKLAAIG